MSIAEICAELVSAGVACSIDQQLLAARNHCTGTDIDGCPVRTISTLVRRTLATVPLDRRNSAPSRARGDATCGTIVISPESLVETPSARSTLPAAMVMSLVRSEDHLGAGQGAVRVRYEPRCCRPVP